MIPSTNTTSVRERPKKLEPDNQNEMSTIVPGSTAGRSDGDQEAIAALAFELWKERGCPEGSPEEDWHKAEFILAQGGSARRAG